MKDEEIKKMAREYAKEILSKQPMMTHAIPEVWEKAVADTEKPLAELFEPLIAYISKDYCIVPKEKLDALQDEIHGEIMCAHDDDDWQSVAHYILDVMPRSFNDIFGKDMFKEEKI